MRTSWKTNFKKVVLLYISKFTFIKYNYFIKVCLKLTPGLNIILVLSNSFHRGHGADTE